MPNERAFFIPRDTEQGRHQAFKQVLDGEYAFRVYQGATDPGARLDAYNAATAELQGLIAASIQDGKTLRARGSLWSLSPVAVTDGRLIDTKALRLGFDFPAGLVSPTYAGDFRKLRFIECGASVDSVNRYLFADRLSLQASGSNNGQTLVGALSTGTHGGAFGVGAIHDTVVGLHIVAGPGKHVYLERGSQPAMATEFADSLGAQFIRDDGLFNAALVGFGSFGIIHGVVIEARELFLLHALRFVHPFDAALKTAITSLDFSGLALPAAAAAVPKDRPYHFEVFYNPNEGTPPGEAVVLMMYEDAWDESYVAPEWDDGDLGLGAGAIDVMGALLDSLPRPLDQLIVPVLNDQVRDKYAPYYKQGIIRDLFRGEKVLGKTLASGVGVPLDRASDALEIAFAAYRNQGDVLPLILSQRFVKGTGALLGFTRFDPTCVLEIDAVNNAESRKYLKRVWDDLAAAGIPFTLHWGKFNSYLTPARLRSIYGAQAVDQWIAAREELLEGPEVRAAFANPFIKRLNLAG